MNGLWSVTSIVVLGASLIAAVTDVWKFKIYNALTIPLLVSGVLYHAFVGSLWASLLGVVFGFFILFIPFLMGGVSAGDLKLLAGLGAWLRFPGIVYAFIFAGLATALYAFGVLFFRHAKSNAAAHLSKADDCEVSNLAVMNSLQNRREKSIPFGLMVAVSVVVMFLIASASRSS